MLFLLMMERIRSKNLYEIHNDNNNKCLCENKSNSFKKNFQKIPMFEFLFTWYKSRHCQFFPKVFLLNKNYQSLHETFVKEVPLTFFFWFTQLDRFHTTEYKMKRDRNVFIKKFACQKAWNGNGCMHGWSNISGIIIRFLREN